MNKSYYPFFLLFLVVGVFSKMVAQPVLDGSDSGDNDYLSLAEWTQADTGFGDHGMVELKGYADESDLYIMILGECQNNNNDFMVFINSSTETNGKSAGMALPGGSDNLSPFIGFNAIMDFEVDYGIRLTSGENDAFVSIINYTNGSNLDLFLGQMANNGSVLNVSSGTYAGAVFAYDHAGSLSSRAGDEGWEIKIPLSSIGAAPGDVFELFALMSGDDFVSANTLPEIPGQSGTNLGADPNFNTISGNQFTGASVLPVELSSFNAKEIEKGVFLNWETKTETGHSHFIVEKSQKGREWSMLSKINAGITSSGEKQYSFIDETPYAGVNLYRLKQVDYDGSFEYFGPISISVSSINRISISPNPVSSLLLIDYSDEIRTNSILRIYDLTGKLLMNRLLSKEIDLSTLNPGKYFLTILNENAIIYSQRIFKY